MSRRSIFRPEVRVLAFVSLCLSMSAARATDPPEAPQAQEAPEEDGPPRYTLDPDRSTLYVIVYNDEGAMAGRMGHDHVIVASTFSGTVIWDATEPGACAIELEVPVAGLRPDPIGMRQRAGLDPLGAVDEVALQQITRDLLSAGQLDAEQFPTITYRASDCAITKGTIHVTGQLSLRGQTKSLSMPVTLEADGTTLSAGGTFDVLHTDFGFKPFTSLGGMLRNRDRMRFVIALSGTR